MKIMNEYEKLMAEYSDEVRQRWGSTDAYKEGIQRTEAYTEDNWDKAYNKMDEVLCGFAELKRRGIDADDEPAKIQVRKLQKCITDNYYTCTKEILLALGQMYVEDERFKLNIDKHGEGTAEYISGCIERYFH